MNVINYSSKPGVRTVTKNTNFPKATFYLSSGVRFQNMAGVNIIFICLLSFRLVNSFQECYGNTEKCKRPKTDFEQLCLIQSSLHQSLLKKGSCQFLANECVHYWLTA